MSVFTGALYVVCKTNFIYDDSIYENEKGDPVKVFSSKDKAEEYVKEMSYRDLSSIDLNLYGYSLCDIFLCAEDAYHFWVEEFDTTLDDFESILIPENVTKEQLDSIIAMLNFKFYTITEVEA